MSPPDAPLTQLIQPGSHTMIAKAATRNAAYNIAKIKATVKFDATFRQRLGFGPDGVAGANAETAPGSRGGSSTGIA